MKNLPILRYNDLKELLYYSSVLISNGLVLDDGALEVMLRIEKIMQRLEVMGDDDQRRLWIEIKAPRKCFSMENADKNGNYWFQIYSARFEDFHHMLLWSIGGRHVDLRNRRLVGEERIPDEGCGDVSISLQKLEVYIKALVDFICENPEEYNNYVEENLPYSKRKGIIKRSDLNRICPVYRMFDDPKRVVDIVTRMNNLPLWTSDKMTLRPYIHIWRLLYETYKTKDEFRPEPKSTFADKTDEEVFMRYNLKGNRIKGLDLDSEQDYQRWEDENNFYHCMDVAYARIHFYPQKKDNRWSHEDVPVAEGQWYFNLNFDVYGYSNDVVNMLEALCEEGIGVVCKSSYRLLRMAEETDFVVISPNPYSYCRKMDIGNEISLPSEEDGITAQQVNDVIAATEWEPIRKVKPIKKNKV